MRRDGESATVDGSRIMYMTLLGQRWEVIFFLLRGTFLVGLEIPLHHMAFFSFLGSFRELSYCFLLLTPLSGLLHYCF